MDILRYPHTRSMREPDEDALAWPSWDQRLDAALEQPDADHSVLAIAALLAEPF